MFDTMIKLGLSLCLGILALLMLFCGLLGLFIGIMGVYGFAISHPFWAGIMFVMVLIFTYYIYKYLDKEFPK